MRRKCQNGYTMNSEGACVRSNRRNKPVKRHRSDKKYPVLENPFRDPMNCCIRKCDVRTSGGQLVQEGYIHRLECSESQGDCSCDNQTQSGFEGWLTSCSMYSWGDNYPCGSWATGNYYCEQGSYTHYECPNYPIPDVESPPKEI